MRYDGDYVKDSIAAYSAQFSDEYEKAAYYLEIDGIMKSPPIMKLCQFMQDTSDMEMQDLMVRYCLNEMQVTIFLDGVSVGGFRRNNVDDSWEVIPVINEHPKCYELICNVVTGFLAKKFILPRKKTDDPAAVKAK